MPAGKYSKMPGELWGRIVVPGLWGRAALSPAYPDPGSPGLQQRLEVRTAGNKVAAVPELVADGTLRLQGAGTMTNICRWQPPSQTMDVLVMKPIAHPDK